MSGEGDGGPNREITRSSGVTHDAPETPNPNPASAQNSVPKWLIPIAFFVGVGFTIAILILAVKIPNPSKFQFTIFRIVIALGGSAFSMALTGFLTIQMDLPRGGQIVAGGALAVFVILYFFSPSIPGFPKPAVLVDDRGNTLQSPANEYELQVIHLMHEIMDLRQYEVSAKTYPESRQKLEGAKNLAANILSFSDSNLNPRRRYIKYEYAAYAFVDAATGAMYEDDRMKAENYASQAVANADSALSMLDAAQNTYGSNADSRFLVDWVRDDDGRDRVLYLRAMAACELANTAGNTAMNSKALSDWQEINPSFRRKYPASGTPELAGCVTSESR
jgi:hypothetical protein